MSGPGRDGRTRIKICGVTSIETAKAAISAGADAIGFVFSPASPRAIHPDAANDIADQIPPFITAVGVFVISEMHAGDSMSAWDAWRFPAVQLHGRAERQRVRELSIQHKAIRAIPFDAEDIATWQELRTIDALLIDSRQPGSGEAFEHDALRDVMPTVKKPVILAGGLTPGNVGEAIRTVQPWGVDVSSGVESSRGVKDASLIRDFCHAVREADAVLDAQGL